MPTYEYKCDACGNKFEKFQSIKAGPSANVRNVAEIKSAA